MAETVRKQRAAKKNSVSAGYFENVFMSASVGMAIVCPDTHSFLHVNRKICQISGFTETELKERSIFALLHPEDLREYYDNLKKVLNGEVEDYTVALRCVRSDDIPFWVRLNATILRGGGRQSHAVCTLEDISAERTAFEHMSVAESQLRALVDNTNDGIWIIDTDNCFVLANEAFCKGYGVTTHEIVGMHSSSLGIQQVGAHAAMNKAVIETGELRRQVFTQKMKNGKSRTYMIVKFPIFSNPGKVTAVGAISTDVSNLMKTEKDLQRSMAQLKLVTDSLPVLIEQVDADLRFRFINKTGEDWYSLDSSKIIGAHVRDVMGAEAFESLESSYASALSGETLYLDGQTAFPDGKGRYTSRVFVPHKTPQGKIVGAFCLTRDISAKREAEAALRIRNRAIEATQTGIFITDASSGENPIMFVNPALEKITGCASNELVGKTVAQLFQTEADMSDYTEILDAMSKGQAAQSIVESSRKDGTPVWSELKLTPVASDENSVANFVGIVDDITERIRTEEHLNQAIKMEAVGQLTGGVAHDFNNLLTVVIGNMQLLCEELNPKSNHFDWASMSLDAAMRGAELTKQLLAFSRKQVLAPRAINLREIVNGFVPMLQHSLGGSVNLNINVKDSIWPVHIDATQFETALLNLSINARDAMPTGGFLTITARNVLVDSESRSDIEGLKPGPYAVVEVSDTGTGIPKDKIEHVFNPFFTTKEVGKGTGLGLSMIFGFMKQSGGHASIYSEEDVGTCVRLYFPRYDGSQSIAPKSKQEVDKGAVNGRGEHVLVVEDEDNVRETIVALLKAANYNVRAVSNGQDALLDLATTDAIDILLTDVVMPGDVQGPEVAALALEMHPEIAVVVSSGYPRESEALKCLVNDDVPFIAKPYQREEVLQCIAQALHKRKSAA